LNHNYLNQLLTGILSSFRCQIVALSMNRWYYFLLPFLIQKVCHSFLLSLLKIYVKKYLYLHNKIVDSLQLLSTIRYFYGLSKRASFWDEELALFFSPFFNPWLLGNKQQVYFICSRNLFLFYDCLGLPMQFILANLTYILLSCFKLWMADQAFPLAAYSQWQGNGHTCELRGSETYFILCYFTLHWYARCS